MSFGRIILLLLLFVSACSGIDPVSIKMGKAESLVASNPDSALKVMASIPMEQVNTPALKANFILLYVQILERNNLPLVGESYMEDAVAYFSRYGNGEQKMLSAFYLGKLYAQDGNLYGAMEQYVLAEAAYRELPESSLTKSYPFWNNIMARLNIGKGDIYLQRLNYAAALKMYGMAAASLAGERANPLLMEVNGKMGDAYRSEGDFREALDSYNAARDLAEENGRGKELLRFLTASEGVNFSLGHPSKRVLAELDSIYAVYCNGKPPVGDYLLLSRLYLDNGNLTKARFYAKEYERLNSDIPDLQRSRLYSLLVSIESARADYKEALSYERRYNAIMESIMEQEKQNSISQVEQAYFTRQLQLENETIKKGNRLLTIIYSLIFLMVAGGAVALVLIWRKKIRRKNIQVEEYLEAMRSSEMSNRKLLSQLDIHKENEKHLKELLENRFAELRELAGTYYEFGFSKKMQKKVEQLLSFKSVDGDMFAIIEEVVNAKNNNVSARVREAYPSISEDNIRLLNLIYAGFSPQEISVIVNDTPQNIYVRKSRLKRKIAPLIEQNPDMDW